MRMLHTDRGLPMKSNRSLFRTGSANAFTGIVNYCMVLSISSNFIWLQCYHIICVTCRSRSCVMVND